MEQVEWKGIAEERFRPYKQWVTPSGYLCGTYAAAVFLAYYQDYIDETIIPKAFRRKTAGSDSSDGNAAGADSASWVADDRLAGQSWIDSVFDQFNCLTADVRLLLAAGIERANESMKANR